MNDVVITDKLLMDRVALGDKQAFLLLFRPYEKEVLTRSRLLAGSDGELANRVAKEAYQAAYRKIVDGERPQSLCGWMDGLLTQAGRQCGPKRGAPGEEAAVREVPKPRDGEPIPDGTKRDVYGETTVWREAVNPRNEEMFPNRRTGGGAAPVFTRPAQEQANAARPSKAPVADCANVDDPPRRGGEQGSPGPREQPGPRKADGGGNEPKTGSRSAAVAAQKKDVSRGGSVFPAGTRKRGQASDAPRKRGEGSLANRVAMIAAIAAAACLAWMLIALLMRLQVLPGYDIGQGWFNQFIYPLF